jgi:DNA (cytosine-5)-methyltransferase 1
LLSAAIEHRPLAERGPDFPPLRREEQQGSAWQVILDELEIRLGYQLVWGLVDAADYGVPQNRLRVLILGSRDAEFVTRELAHVMPPTHRGKWRTLGDALRDLHDPCPEFLEYTPERKRVLDLVPEGMNWRYFRDHPDHGPGVAAELLGGAWEADGGRVGFFRRLTWNKPSPTLPTSPIQKSTCLCHPEHTRPLTVREYAAIQQFPDGYRFCGGTGQKYKQIGNAVPVGLGKAIGQALTADGTRAEYSQIRLFENRADYAEPLPVS